MVTRGTFIELSKNTNNSSSVRCFISRCDEIKDIDLIN